MTSWDLTAVDHTARKGVELMLRTLGQAPEHRAARRLRDRLSIVESGHGPKILMLTPRNWAAHVQYESMIGQALRLRGAQVTVLGCGGGLEICDRANTHEAPPMPCRSCERYCRDAAAAHGFRRVTLSQFADGGDDGSWPELDELSIDELPGVRGEGLPLGELVDIPVKWFLCAADQRGDPLAARTRRAFMRSARRVARAVHAALDEIEPDTVLVTNGLFLFEAVMWAACRARGIDVVTYERAFRKETLVFHRDAPAGHYDFASAWSDAKRPLTVAEERELDSYLDDRRAGRAFDQHWDWRPPALPRTRGRMAVMFTNITWDSAVIGRDRAFASIEKWVSATIAWFGRSPDHTLVVRIHPSEIALPGKRSRDSLHDYIAREHPDLPANVVVIPPDDASSSYPLMDECDLGLVYTSTTGLELALAGKPVIVTGIPHYRGKGFTIDVDSASEYREALSGVMGGEVARSVDVELARRYAHFFFFRAPIAAPGVIEPIPGLARVTIEDPTRLEPGVDPELDRICDGILDGAAFVSA